MFRGCGEESSIVKYFSFKQGIEQAQYGEIVLLNERILRYVLSQLNQGYFFSQIKFFFETYFVYTSIFHVVDPLLYSWEGSHHSFHS